MNPFHSVRSRCGPCLLTVVLLTVVSGCAGKGDASGKVTYKGNPLVWGSVQFEDGEGMLKQANINPDGTYSVQGLAVGEAKVAISSINPNSSDFQVRGVGGKPPPPRRAIKGWFPIPDKYDAPHKSELVFTIKPGPNAIDIELK